MKTTYWIGALLMLCTYQYTIATTPGRAACLPGHSGIIIADTLPVNRYLPKKVLPVTTQRPTAYPQYNPSNPVNPLYPNNQDNPAYPNTPSTPLYPNNQSTPASPTAPAVHNTFPTNIPVIPPLRPATPLSVPAWPH